MIAIRFTVLLLVLGSVFVVSQNVRAQSAADPQAIDFTGRMDTITSTNGSSITLTMNLNIGDRNHDGWDDFEIDKSALSSFSEVRYGGPWIFDSVNVSSMAGLAQFYGDFDGDGILDVVDNFKDFHKGSINLPYFEHSGAGLPRFDPFFPSEIQYVTTGDYDVDGIDDAIGFATGETPSSWLLLYPGGSQWHDSRINPSDSIRLDSVADFYGAELQRFGKHQLPTLVFQVRTREFGHDTVRVGMLKRSDRFTHDTVVWMSSLDGNYVHGEGIYATDITGDGIPDLLVSTGDTVFIFKGGDDFGTYPLTSEHAYYKIPSPNRFDRSGKFLEVFRFGEYMHALGDLSGSGIPYIMIEADFDLAARSFCMIYAGGKALDSLYDGIFTYDGNSICPVDTLHSIDGSGRSAGLVVHNNDRFAGFRDFDNLLFRDCDKLPHRTNPNLRDVAQQRFTPALTLTASPAVANRFVKIHIDAPTYGHAVLAVCDALGRTVLERSVTLSPGSAQEYFETSQLATGTYWIRISQSQKLLASTKVIVQH